jgi:hypothetical protein
LLTGVLAPRVSRGASVGQSNAKLTRSAVFLASGEPQQPQS